MNFKLLFASVMMSALLAGCGIKGPLYIPQDQSAVTNTTTSTTPDGSPNASDASKQNTQDDEIMTDEDNVQAVFNSNNASNKVSATVR